MTCCPTATTRSAAGSEVEAEAKGVDVDFEEECEARRVWREAAATCRPPSAAEPHASPALWHGVELFDVVALFCEKVVQEVAFQGRWRAHPIVGGRGAAPGEEAEALRWLAFVIFRRRVRRLLWGAGGSVGADRLGARHRGATGRSRCLFEDICMRHAGESLAPT